MSLPFRTMTDEEVDRIMDFPRASVLFVTVLLFVGDEIVLFELDPTTHGGGWSPPRAVVEVNTDPVLRARACLVLDTGLQLPATSFKFFHTSTVLTDTGELAEHEYSAVRWPAEKGRPRITPGNGAISHRYFDPNDLPPDLQLQGERELIPKMSRR